MMLVLPYRYLLAACLWLLLLQAAGAQPRPGSPADSLRQALRHAPPDTNRVNLLLRLGQQYADIPTKFLVDMDSAKAYAKRADALSRRLHYVRGYDQSQLLTTEALLNRFVDITANQPTALLRNWRLRSNSKALLLVGKQFLRRPNATAADFKSAQDYAQRALATAGNARDTVGQISSLLTLGEIYSIENKLDDAFEKCHKAQILIQRVKNRSTQARLWYLLGDVYSRSPKEMPVKITCYEHAAGLYHQLGNRDLEAFSLKEVADMHQSQGYFPQSLRELLRVISLQRATRSPRIQYTYDLIGAVYSAMGNYEQSLPYALATLESARATKDTTLLYNFWWRIGRLYEELGQNQQALSYFRQMFAKAQQGANGPYDITSTVYISKQLLLAKQSKKALAFMQRVLKRSPITDLQQRYSVRNLLGETYLSLKNYALAEQNFMDALRVVKQSGFKLRYDKQEEFTTVYANLSRLYTAQGHYAKARQYSELAFRTLRRTDVTQLKGLHQQAFRLDSLQGNFLSAIAHYEQYKALNDSIFNARKSSQLIGFQVYYDTKAKEQEISLNEQRIALLTQRNRAQQASLGLQQTQRNALLIGAVLLLAILGLVYNRYRLKQRSNQLLLGQQLALHTRQEEIDRKNAVLEVLLTEKEWLLKEIHHRVKNNLQIITSLLNSQASSLTDSGALLAIRESQHRVQAMALLHQRLYQSERVARVNMPAYLQEVVAYLHDAYEEMPVRFELDIAPVELDIALAVPLGLIVNEALTNVFKYAFPMGPAGRVWLALRQVGEATYRLEITDNGVGLPPAYAPARSRSLGMTLLHGFSRQLGGELHLSGPPGLTITLTFHEEALLSPITSPDYAP